MKLFRFDTASVFLASLRALFKSRHSDKKENGAAA